MPEDRVDKIRISERLLRIGNQAYPLANIGRVQTLWIQWGHRIATFREFVGLLVVISVLVFVLPGLGLEEDSASALTVTVVVIAGLVVLSRLLNRERRFVLLIETTGAQTAALAGKAGQAEREIREIEQAVVTAIENPPAHEQVLQVSGDIVMGDKINRDKYQQGGSGNSIFSS